MTNESQPKNIQQKPEEEAVGADELKPSANTVDFPQIPGLFVEMKHINKKTVKDEDTNTDVEVKDSRMIKTKSSTPTTEDRLMFNELVFSSAGNGTIHKKFSTTSERVKSL